MRVFSWMLLLAVLVAVAGCSSAAMKSTPLSLWDDPEPVAIGPAEGRVNFWPLFYYRKPALSILWPFFAMTDEEHAFVPLYEYDRSKERLRVGSIHQALWSLADFKPQKKEWRILNTWKDEDSFFFVPLVYGNWEDKSFAVVPIIGHDDDLWWTLPYTHAKDFNGILGPLFFLKKNDVKTFAMYPAPLAAYWHEAEETGSMLLPLYYHESREDGATTNLGALLFHRKAEGDDRWFWYLAGLGGAGHEKKSRWNRLLPLWYFSADAKDSLFLSFPFSHSRSESGGVTNVLLPGYLKVWDKDSFVAGYGLPFFWRFGGKKGGGSMLLPLYYHKSEDDETTFLTPLFGVAPNMQYWGGPAFVSIQRNKGYFRSFVWPLSGFWKDDQKRGSWMAPLWLEKSGEKKSCFLTPLVSWGHDEKRGFFNLLMLVFHGSRSEGEYDYDGLLGLMGASKAQRQNRREVWCHPLFKWIGSDKRTEIRTLLLKTRWRKQSRAEIEAEMTEVIRKRVEDFHAKDFSTTETLAHIQNIPRWTGETQSRTSSLFWLYGREKSLTAKWAEKDNPEAGLRFLEKRQSHLFPIYAHQYQEGQGGSFSFIWRVFDTKTVENVDAPDYYRQRVLWRLFHREVQGDEARTDVFPFIVWDRTKDTRAFSFAGGLLGYESEKGNRTLRFLWIPIPVTRSDAPGD